MPSWMTKRIPLRSEDLLRTVATVGAIVLCCWLGLGLAGTALGALWPEYHAMVRLAVSALTVMGPYVLVNEIRQLHLRRIPPDERYGFAVGHPSGPSAT